jgi:elongation factor P--beta-lysine ligase
MERYERHLPWYFRNRARIGERPRPEDFEYLIDYQSFVEMNDLVNDREDLMKRYLEWKEGADELEVTELKDCPGREQASSITASRESTG